jgi:rhodanese-related sulfurtransferase
LEDSRYNKPENVLEDPMKKLLTVLTTLALTVTVFAGEFPDISIADLKAAIAAKKVVVIDVNGSTSYKNGHIPGAIDYTSSKDKLAQLLPSDKKTLIVAYCGGPTCNAYQSAAKAAKSLGYTNVKHLSAGISGWLQAGEKTEKPSKSS